MRRIREINPREQFSKKLATWTARFWFFFMTAALACSAWAPESADAAVYLAICGSVVMLVNVWAYTKNSVYEKAILAGIEKAWIGGLKWKSCGSQEDAGEEEPDTEAGLGADEEVPEQEGGNG